jgi:hypothetical protein
MKRCPPSSPLPLPPAPFSILHPQSSPATRSPTATSEMLLLPDGRLLVHNLTPALADWLCELNPGDPQLAPRTTAEAGPTPRAPSHSP